MTACDRGVTARRNALPVDRILNEAAKGVGSPPLASNLLHCVG
jgi:hypothetical protein